MLKGFKDFILRGNVIELSVAVVMAAAFGAVIDSFTKGVVDPLLAAIGGPDSIGLGFNLRPDNPNNPATFVDLGGIITAAITFLITAAVIYFILIVPMNKATELAARRKGLDHDEAVDVSDTELLMEIRDLLKESTTGEKPKYTKPEVENPENPVGKHAIDPQD